MFFLIVLFVLLSAFFLTGFLAMYQLHKYYKRCNDQYDKLYETPDDNFEVAKKGKSK